MRVAVGGGQGDIRTQFLVEAVMLALVGGLAGIVAGEAIVAGLRTLLGWPMALRPVAVAMSVGVSAATGVLFGLLPARRAALLEPIDALRHQRNRLREPNSA